MRKIQGRECLTLIEAGEFLGVSRKTLIKYRRIRNIQEFRVGGLTYLPKDQLEALLSLQPPVSGGRGGYRRRKKEG